MSGKWLSANVESTSQILPFKSLMNSFASHWGKREITKVEKCRICYSTDLTTFIHLGPIPIPNGFLKKSELNFHEKSYPLDAAFCKKCGLVQLSHIIKPEIMFKNYAYVPSTSITMVDHFRELASFAANYAKLTSEDLVVDIGSNDGTLLSIFKSKGIKILGVDPAKNLANKANRQGIRTINNYFTQKAARNILKRYGPAKVICATNVVAHVHDLHDFFEGVKLLLSKDGAFIAEFPYVLDLLSKVEFDTIYQEHLAYFSVTSFSKLVKMHGLNLVDVTRMPIHGGSLRCIVKTGHKGKNQTVKNLLILETKKGLMNPQTYLKFASQVENLRHDLVSLLLSLRAKNKRIAGYGASAKGNIITNYCKIGPETLDYIVDSISYKQGRFTPGMHIPIYKESKLLEGKPDYVLMLAWNFADSIMKRHKAFRERGGQFIIPMPEARIVE